MCRRPVAVIPLRTRFLPGDVIGLLRASPAVLTELRPGGIRRFAGLRRSARPSPHSCGRGSDTPQRRDRSPHGAFGTPSPVHLGSPRPGLRTAPGPGLRGAHQVASPVSPDTLTIPPSVTEPVISESATTQAVPHSRARAGAWPSGLPCSMMRGTPTSASHPPGRACVGYQGPRPPRPDSVEICLSAYYPYRPVTGAGRRAEALPGVFADRASGCAPRYADRMAEGTRAGAAGRPTGEREAGGRDRLLVYLGQARMDDVVRVFEYACVRELPAVGQDQAPQLVHVADVHDRAVHFGQCCAGLRFRQLGFHLAAMCGRATVSQVGCGLASAGGGGRMQGAQRCAGHAEPPQEAANPVGIDGIIEPARLRQPIPVLSARK